MNKQQELAKRRLEAPGTGNRARRINSKRYIGTDVKVDRRGNGIPTHNFISLPEPNNMRPPTGNRERARRARQQESRA